MAPLWRMGRSQKSSSTPRPGSTQVTTRQAQAGLSPCHSDKCDLPPVPRRWGGGQTLGWAHRDNPSVLGADQAWPWTDRCQGQGQWVAVQVPTFVPEAQGSSRPAPCPGLRHRVRSIKLHIAMHSRPYSAGARASSGWSGFHVLSFSAAPRGRQGLALMASEALACLACTCAGHWSFLGAGRPLEALPRRG